MQLIVSLVNTARFDEATVAARSLRDTTLSRDAWALIASANANLQRLGAALDAVGFAVDRDQSSRSRRLQRALRLEGAGRPAKSFDVLERLALESADYPGLLAHLITTRLARYDAT